MTNLSTSLSNALSGLSVLSRITETVSSNVSNALNENYAARDVVVGSRVVGGRGAGAQVVGLQRYVDPVLLADRRSADAALGIEQVRAEFFIKEESVIGLPDDPSSLSGRLSQFGADLIQAASRPDSDARLETTLRSAQALASHLTRLCPHT